MQNVCLPHLSGEAGTHSCLSSPCLFPNLPSFQKQQQRATESFLSCLGLGTNRVLWHENPAGVHTDACLPLSLVLQSPITLDVITGSKVGKQEPTAGEAS